MKLVRTGLKILVQLVSLWDLLFFRCSGVCFFFVLLDVGEANILARVRGHQATPWNWWLKKEEVKETCLWVWESV